MGVSGRTLLGIGGLGGRFSVKGKRALGTISSISFRVGRKRAFKVINRSNYKGSATKHAVVNLCGHARNSILCSKGGIRAVARGREFTFREGVRVVFRSPCTSLGPQSAIRRVVSRPVRIRKLCPGGGRQLRQICRLLRSIKLGHSRTGHCPRRFDNKREREVKVTHTLTLSPRFVVTSRPVSTLSMSMRTRMIGLLGKLRGGGNLACLFVTRSLSVIGRVDSEVNIVCLKGLIRLAADRGLCGGPLRPCARTLLSTVPVPSPSIRSRQREVVLRKRLPDPVGPPDNYMFHAHYPCTVRTYTSVGPR